MPSTNIAPENCGHAKAFPLSPAAGHPPFPFRKKLGMVLNRSWGQGGTLLLNIPVVPQFSGTHSSCNGGFFGKTSRGLSDICLIHTTTRVALIRQPGTLVARPCAPAVPHYSTTFNAYAPYTEIQNIPTFRSANLKTCDVVRSASNNA